MVSYRVNRLVITCSRTDASHEIKGHLANIFVRLTTPIKLDELFSEVSDIDLGAATTEFLRLKINKFVVDAREHGSGGFVAPYWEDAWKFHSVSKARVDTEFATLEEQNAKYRMRLEREQQVIRDFGSTKMIRLASHYVENCKLPIEDLLERRRTRRTFGQEPVSFEHASRILRATFKVVREWKHRSDSVSNQFRSSPSAGGLLAVDAIVVSLNIKSLPRSIYRLVSNRQGLVDCEVIPVRDWVERAFAGQNWVADSGMVVVFTANFARLSQRYSAGRLYRVAATEAGHLGQSLLLVAEQLGLAGFAVGGINEEFLEVSLKLDRTTEVPIYGVGVGARSSMNVADEWERQALETSSYLAEVDEH